MKKLEELGISPAPWRNCKPYNYIVDSKSVDLTDSEGGFIKDPDARLIVAAPKLYQALYKITKEQECGRDCSKCKNDGCVIQECRAALAEAAGESEVAE